MPTPNEDRELTERGQELWDKKIYPFDVTPEELDLTRSQFKQRGADFHTPSDLDYRIYGYGDPYAIISANRRLDTITEDEERHILYNIRQRRLKGGLST